MTNDIVSAPIVIDPHDRREWHVPLATICAACFIGGLLTDVTYWRDSEMTWADLSAWLITVGTILGILTLILGIIDRLSKRWRRGTPLLYLIFSLIALAFGIVNTLIHSRDAWTSVVPFGLILSILTVVFVIAAALSRCMSDSGVYRGRRLP